MARKPPRHTSGDGQRCAAVAPDGLTSAHQRNKYSHYLTAVFPDFVTYVLPPGYTTAVPTAVAHPGDTIVLLEWALGPVNPAPVPAGQKKKIATQASTLVSLPVVSFAGTCAATVTYAGLVPGTLGPLPDQCRSAQYRYARRPNLQQCRRCHHVQVNGVTLPTQGPVPMFLTLPVAQK